MIFDITKENYNKTLNNLQNAGFKIDTVPFEFGNMQINQKLKTPSTGENENENENENSTSTTNEVERASLTIELPLPDANKKLDDYASIMLWFNSVDGYMSYSLPISWSEYHGSITNPTEDQIIRAAYKVYGSGSGKFILKASVTNDDYSFFDLLEDSDCYLMFLSTDNFKFNYKETVVVESLSTLFNLCTAEDSKDLADLILSEKTNLITADYDSESQIAGCYKLSACEPYNTDETEIVYDASTLTYSYKGCAYKATTLPTYGKRYTVRQFGAVGYTQAELDGMTDSEKGNIAASNAAALNSASNMCAQIGREYNRAIELSFEPNLIYLLGSVVYFSSDTEFIGNNAIIRLFNNTEKEIYAFSNKQVLNTDDDYGNVGFYDLTIEGRYGADVPKADQAIKCGGDSVKTIPKNVTFVNFTAKDVCYGIHINNNTYYDIPLYWTFDNCEFLHTATGFMLTGVSKLSLLNSHIDNSLSQAKGEHCIYVSEKCSYLTVDNCLLENSAGGAIHQMFGFALYDSTFNEHNTYKNLTISSCFTAIHIGPASRDTVVENVVVVDAWRIIMLESCIETKIRNVKATGVFYDKMLDRKSHEWKDPDDKSSAKWFFIRIKGMVDADIEDCNFKFSSPFSDCCAYSNEVITSDDIDPSHSNIAPEAISVFENHSEWFDAKKTSANESFFLVTPSVRFKNCQFDSTYNLNDYTNVLGYQANQKRKKEENEDQEVFDEEKRQAATNTFLIINNNSIVAKVVYKLIMTFDNCRFRMNFDTMSAPYFRSTGNMVSEFDSASEFVFKECEIAYYIENQIQRDIAYGYFFESRQGSTVSITNCSFYKNKNVTKEHDFLCCKPGSSATQENNNSYIL